MFWAPDVADSTPDFPSYPAMTDSEMGIWPEPDQHRPRRQPQGFCLSRAECGKMSSLMLLSPNRELLQRKQDYETDPDSLPDILSYRN